MTDTDTLRLGAIRRRHQEASVEWAFALTNDGEVLTARPIPGEDPYTVLTFRSDCAYADREQVSHAHEDVGFLLELLDRSFAAVRQLRRALDRRNPKPKDFSAECAMKCQDANFQRWLHEVHGLDNPHEKERAATKVRFMLEIESRAELNTDPDAAQRWRKMVEDADNWSKQRRNHR